MRELVSRRRKKGGFCWKEGDKRREERHKITLKSFFATVFALEMGKNGKKVKRKIKMIKMDKFQRERGESRKTRENALKDGVEKKARNLCKLHKK